MMASNTGTTIVIPSPTDSHAPTLQSLYGQIQSLTNRINELTGQLKLTHEWIFTTFGTRIVDNLRAHDADPATLAPIVILKEELPDTVLPATLTAEDLSVDQTNSSNPFLEDNITIHSDEEDVDPDTDPLFISPQRPKPPAIPGLSLKVDTHLQFQLQPLPLSTSTSSAMIRSRTRRIAPKKTKTKDRPDPDKLYQCNQCNARFTDRSNALRHERSVHAGEKPHKCQYCNAAFFHSYRKADHERVHTGERPYACSYCNRAFNTSTDRKKHEARHTGEKVYNYQKSKIMF